LLPYYLLLLGHI